MKEINLPCLRGNFGDWIYFSSVMKVKDILENRRVITVPESAVLYSNNINKVLQREVDESRINKIKKYILLSKERFFSSLIAGIHGGDPKWADIDLEKQYRIDNKIIPEEDVNFIENKIGILTLNGSEEIFVLDGQHRLLGLRKAISDNPEIGNEELSIIFIVHRENLKERTRRLFTVLNRYAVAIKAAEKVILEEDDAAAILTRKLVQEYKTFILDDAVSESKQFSLSPTDTTHFTTLVCLYEINKILINYKQLYKSKVIIRPNDSTLKLLYKEITQFWDFFFSVFPDVIKFIKKEKIPIKFKRNKETGGSLLLRPEGQLLFATIYKEFESSSKLSVFKTKVQDIDFDLSSTNWKYVFWTGSKMNGKNKKLKSAIFSYLLGKRTNEQYVHSEMIKIYKDYNIDYKKRIKPVI